MSHTHSKDYYRMYNASPAGKARLAKFTVSPKRKVYRAAWNDRNIEHVRAYQRAYYHRVVKIKQQAAFALVKKNCATLLCTGTFWYSATDGRRKFCGVCQYTFGHAATERYRWRKKHGRAA